MNSGKLQENILSTYFWLRGGIVFLSFVLPIALYVGGRAGLLESMSAYYGGANAFARNWFVGTLWVVGAFLILYKGFSDTEDLALNAAGVFALLVPMVPCNCWPGAVGGTSAWHAVAAVAFFLSMATVCLFCANDTISLLPDARTKQTFRRQYRTIGILMVASPFVAILVSYTLNEGSSYKFFVEAFGVYVFAYYWLTKSREFRITSAEKLAAHGKVENRKGVGLVRVDTVSHP